MINNRIRIVVPGFTVSDGWARGFDVSQTSIWTGKPEAEVVAEYQLLGAAMEADMAEATDGCLMDLFASLHAPEGAYVPFHHPV